MQDFSPISGIGSIPSDAGRQKGRGQRDASGRKPSPGVNQPPDAGAEAVPEAGEEPTAALVEALDRLRATHELSPSEETTRRLMRGQRYYQEQDKHAAPAADEGEAFQG